MKKALILVEGLTEESFVKFVLSPHLAKRSVFPDPIIIRTRQPQGSNPAFKGGRTTWAKIKKFLLNLLNDSSASLVTTMLDYYARPSDFPGNGSLPAGSCFDRVQHLENACRMEIGQHRFLPYLSLHEFEALLFSSPEQIALRFPSEDRSREIAIIKAKFNSPEEINDDPATAPSKRIEQLYPQYRKRVDGTIIAQNITLDLIRSECRHFNEWLTKLESLGGDSN